MRGQVRGWSAGAVLALSCCGAACDAPGTFTVGSTSDSGESSLRAAIAWANASSGRNVRIELPPGEYRLTRCGSDDANSSGDLDLTTTRAVTIAGAGPGVVIRQTCAGERVLQGLGTGLLTLSRVQISGGSAASDDPAEPARGGGLRVRGSLKLDESTVRENSVTGAPGQSAATQQLAIAAGHAQGGGVFVEGSLHATHSVFSSNTARGGSGTPASGADDWASAGGAAEGGAAYVGGIVSIEAGTLAENRAIGGDGGLGPENPGGGGLARGGAVAQAGAAELPVTLANVMLSANSALGGASGGGDLLAGSAPLPAGSAHGGAVACAGPLYASAVVASQNAARGGSAGIGGCPAGTVCNSAAEAGAARGGAIASGGESTIADGTFSDNRAVSGDALFGCATCPPVSAAAAPSEGGAVWSGADVSLTDVSFVENEASQGSGSWTSEGAARGGAVAASGALSVAGGTFSGNAVSQGRGGALSGGRVSVQAVTLSGNRASGSGGAIHASTALTAASVSAMRNTAGGAGGGAIAVTGDAELALCRITGNSVESRSGSARGAGVFATGSLVVRDTEVSENAGRSWINLGRFGTFSSLFAGGGVSAGSVTAERATFASNSVFSMSTGASPYPPGLGGGGAIDASGSVSLVNVTITGNSVNEPSSPLVMPNLGAAVLAPSLVLEHATITENVGAASLRTAQLTTHCSVLLASAPHSACEAGTSASAATYNQFSDASCALTGAGNQQGATSFLLGPLVENGGAVSTRLPAYASPLVDAVPPAACPIAEDARGVVRPRGAACDIGAVELQPLSGTGSANWTLTFTDPPSSATPGDSGRWQLTLRNAGPNASAPAVRITLPEGVTLIGSSATAGGACSLSRVSECVFESAIAPGAAAHITLDAHIDAGASAPLTWTAEVFAPDLRAPFDDDRAELTTPLAPRTGITMSARFARFSDTPGHQFRGVALELFNAGPSHAVGTPSAPIQVLFHPAPGVRATQTPEPLVGSFAPGAEPFHTLHIGFLVDGDVPAELGTFELLPGANVQPAVPPLPVYAADLELRAYRPAAGEPPGSPIQYRIEVENRGPATATDVMVSLQSSAQNTWNPSHGTITGDSTWSIPSLEPGQTATLTSSATIASSLAVTSASILARTVDLNPENDDVELRLDPAPQGTADLQISSLQAYPGAAENQRILRATVTNRGPAASLASESEPLLAFVTQLVDARATVVRALDPGWVCSTTIPIGCVSAEPITAGATVSFEIVLEGAFPDTFPRPGLWLMPAITPDPDPNNNRRYVSAMLTAGTPSLAARR